MAVIILTLLYEWSLAKFQTLKVESKSTLSGVSVQLHLTRKLWSCSGLRYFLGKREEFSWVNAKTPEVSKYVQLCGLLLTCLTFQTNILCLS